MSIGDTATHIGLLRTDLHEVLVLHDEDVAERLHCLKQLIKKRLLWGYTTDTGLSVDLICDVYTHFHQYLELLNGFPIFIDVTDGRHSS